MNKPSKLTRQTLFDLGFAHGTDVDEDPSELEFRSRVREYQLGYIVGRSFGEAVKQASRRAAAVVAGELGWRFGVSLPELMAAMNLSE
ncbi:hypothetical protein [Paraburkholderia sp. J7]|uniref:hypothetical protein n=1 Tax=Paraburkholderia sp. J7 TaxID=2805438 RepID=UPI002AB781A5|nr:hypothetical protein [Paraburkholderia sp. J7]